VNISPEQRVCPDCGQPAGAQPFCAHCGVNLTGRDRLPSRAEFARAQTPEPPGPELVPIAPPAAPRTEAPAPGSAPVVFTPPTSAAPTFAAAHEAEPAWVPWHQRPMASWGYRVGAQVTDIGLVFAAGYASGVIARAAGASQSTAGTVVGVTLLACFLANAVIVAALTDGQTVGKRLAAIRVVRESGKRYGLGCALLRDVILRVLYIIPLLWLIDWLMPLGEQRQSLRDKIVFTRVMREPPYVSRRWPLTAAASLIAVGWIALIASAAGGAGGGTYSDYDRAQFIAGCTDEGQLTESDCGCAFDHISAQLSYDEYRQADRADEQDWSPHVSRVIATAFDACPGVEG
jgi:uncharacterized RDD family membrane protein YckC